MRVATNKYPRVNSLWAVLLPGLITVDIFTSRLYVTSARTTILYEIVLSRGVALTKPLERCTTILYEIVLTCC